MHSWRCKKMKLKFRTEYLTSERTRHIKTEVNWNVTQGEGEN